MKLLLLISLIKMFCLGIVNFAASQEFSEEINISDTALAPTSVVAFDLDNDNKIDVLSVSDHSINWYINQGGGKFILGKTLLTSESPYSIYAKDLNDDKLNDILAASSPDNRISFFENLKNRDFSSQLTISLEAEGAESIYAINLDSDNYPDILSASFSDNKIAWYKNRLNDPNFQDFGEQDTVTTKAEGARSVFAADLDGDGDNDVLSASSTDNKIAWYENLGNGSFSSPKIVSSVATDAWSVYTADLDNDGDEDVLSACRNGNKIAWYENKIVGISGLSETTGTGGDTITISGQNFDGGLPQNLITFTDSVTGNKEPPITPLSRGDKQIQFKIPETLPSGKYKISLDAIKAGQIDTAQQIFTVEHSLKEISPNNGGAGSTFTLKGTNFGKDKNGITVKLGSQGVQDFTLENDTSLSITVPQLDTGRYDIFVSINSIEKQAAEKFNVISLAPTISSITPPGDLTPGIEITITGTNFDQPGLVVKLEDELLIINGTFTATEIKVTIPPELESDNYNITVITDIASVSQIITVRKPHPTEPVVLSVTSPSGRAGDEITITGNNFGDNIAQITVYFNETIIPTDSVKSVAPTQITVSLPDLDTVTYTVWVKVGTQESNKDQKFEILPPLPADHPTIEGLSANSAPAGSSVTITGKNFGTDQILVKVFFNKTEIPADDFKLKNEKEIEVKVPNLLPGLYNIKIIVEEKHSNQKEFTIAAIAKPTLSQIEPQKITTGASEPITLTGTNFGSDASQIIVTFTDNNGTPQNIPISSLEDGSEITLNVNTLVAGEYTISITVNHVPSETTLSIIIENRKDTINPSLTLSTNDPSIYISDNLVLSAKATDTESGIDTVKFRSSGFTENLEEALWETLTESEDNTYLAHVTDEDFDETGLRYQFRAEDVAGNDSITAEQIIIRQYTAANPVSPGSAWMPAATIPTAKDYQLIAVPFASQAVSSILEELGTQADTSWRLFQYGEDATKPWDTKERAQFIEYLPPKGFTSFEPGKGYFLIYKDQKEINLAGNLPPALQADQSVTISLQPGFNLIGNPYLFPIDWEEVVQYNINPNISSQLKILSRGTGSNTTVLAPFKGAFVMNMDENTSVNIEIPVSAKISSNGRYTQEEGAKKLSPIHAEDWEVPLRLESDAISYHLGAIGMHPKANASADPLDDFTLPRFLEYLELNFYHPEFFMPKFTKDIVPTQEAYTWAFEVASNLSSPEVTLAWDNHYFGSNDLELMLLDLHNFQIINMREVTTYTFSVAEGECAFKIFFGNEATVTANMLPESIAVGEAFPNPMQEQFTIPVSLPKGKSSYDLQLEIYNITGQLVRRIEQASIPAGYQTLRWDRQNQEGKIVSAGLYLYRVNIDNQAVLNNGRIIVR